MPLSPKAVENITRGLNKAGLAPLTTAQIEALAEHVPVSRIYDWISGAIVNEAEGCLALERHTTAVRAHLWFLELGFLESTLPAVLRLLDEHGLAKLRVTAGDASSGEVNARAVLSNWLRGAAHGDSELPGDSARLKARDHEPRAPQGP